jgi:hypothetical protein
VASRTLTAVDRASKTGDNLEEDLRILDKKLGQLRLDYEQYFLGARPREPHLLRQEIQKQVNILAQTPMLNTALRFRFNSICSRFMAFRRQWDAILRQIADGTYKRHVFKANIRRRTPEESTEAPAAAPTAGAARAAPPTAGERLYAAYLEAAQRCGQDVGSLSPAKLAAAVKKQEAAIREKFGCERVRFKVVVEEGKVKLKASPVT